MKNKMIKPIKRMSLRDEVYATLKKAIVTLELKPEQRLSDKELAEQFGISRTPVREALKRLEDEGLIESIPGSATRVAPLHLEEAKHAFTVVAALHALAAKLAVPLLKKSHIEELEFHNKTLFMSLEKKDSIGAIEADEQFHNVFLDAAGNPEIIRALERSIHKIQRLEIAQFTSRNGFKSVEQHKEMIEACKHKNVELVAHLMEQNWLSLGELLTQQTD
ncbi:GntR family transcriptional regulator [Bacillus manliponensis]|uniref:GntR family transcriptional regulator n=1 Tax=Bacillus manliponensis TaxID=574376 RepID=A0A073JZK2_9BACI|nr:GntR family transcriptional regulator [Bacillus manliponensis]KEK19685.1 GntR family transcriptional regulator [Bacillus manliponensis]